MSLIQQEPKKIYIRIETQYVTTPGIYHNASDGLISLSSDGTNWLTIADKNLGAISTDITSSDSYGYYFQYGNIYGFPTTGGVSTSSSAVNASTYGPGNYYSSSTFITNSNGYWDSSNNGNLRGGTTDTNEAKKGPCNTGYHIPSNTEMENLVNLGITLGAWTSSTGSGIRDTIMLPYGGLRNRSSGAVEGQGTYGYYWTATNYSAANAYDLEAISSINHVQNTMKNRGMLIRPFANTPTQPDDSRTVLYQA